MLTEEQESKNDFDDLLKNGSDDEKFSFAVNNVFMLSETLDICAHCIALGVLELMEAKEETDKGDLH